MENYIHPGTYENHPKEWVCVLTSDGTWQLVHICSLKDISEGKDEL
jgi:hypothetical protein